MALSIPDIAHLFRTHGHIAYDGEGVSQLDHALQSGQLAEQDGASPALVTAAFLHDLGHLLNLQGETPTARGVDDQHQFFVVPFLRGLFPPDVIEPIRLHVEAKRALCALEPAYQESLSPDSRRSLALQGGAHTPEEARSFLERPHAQGAIRLRRWDDLAKKPGLAAPPLEHYLDIASRCVAG